MPSSIFDDEHFLDPLEQMRLENVCLQAKLQQAQAGEERSYPIPIACAILLIAVACRVTSGVVAVRDDLRWSSLNDLPDMVEADQAILQRYFREFDHAQPDL